MKQYIGVKRIRAMRMTREAYNDFRGWKVPADENPADAGYLVEYLDGGKANTSLYEGYVSWSPKEVFERAYREADGLDFGFAVQALKAGYMLARDGWNGKGMFLYWVSPGYYEPKMQIAQVFFGGRGVPYREYIAMKTVDDEVVPWVASQTDILAEDWRIVG